MNGDTSSKIFWHWFSQFLGRGKKSRRVINDPLGQTHSYSLFKVVLLCEFLKSGDVRTCDTCENNDHYGRWLWVGRVDQLLKSHVSYVDLLSLRLLFSLLSDINFLASKTRKWEKVAVDQNRPSLRQKKYVLS